MPPRRSQHADVYVARHGFSCVVEGIEYRVAEGERIRGTHPLASAAAEYLEPSDASVHYDVEQATAAPGEKRGER